MKTKGRKLKVLTPIEPWQLKSVIVLPTLYTVDFRLV